MKRIMSLWVVVSVVSILACAGEEAWPAQGTESTLGTESQEMVIIPIPLPTTDGGTSDGGTSSSCGEDPPPVPTVPEVLNLDGWDFTNNALMPLTSTTRSMYLIAHLSPTDPQRMYVYGIDVTAQHFYFVATLNRRYAPQLLQRVAIDIGRFQISGAVNPSSGISIQIEGPAPPPPPPGIHDPQNYAKLGWQVAVKQHVAAQALHY